MKKYSVTIAGHPTSIRIESIFWEALIRESLLMGLPVNALIAQIDAERAARAVSPNLASAIRVWLFSRLAGQPGGWASEHFDASD
jgi:predicted DNA-binding ribbon-helix-helix protein